MCLRAEIRVATSSMTSVPKPLKQLKEHLTSLLECYEKLVGGWHCHSYHNSIVPSHTKVVVILYTSNYWYKGILLGV